MIWSDRRAYRQQQWLEENVDEALQTEINGNRFDASNVGTKALWWKQTHPDLYRKTNMILNAGGYIVYRLTGRYSCNISEADLSQLSDQRRMCWSEDLFDAYGLGLRMFPPIYRGDEVVGGVSESAARLTGLKAGTPVAAGSIDVCATALGAGIFEKGDAVITGGTVTGIAVLNDRFVKQHCSHVYHHAAGNGWIYCASVDFGGGSLRWFRDQFMLSDQLASETYNVMDQMAEGVPAGSENLIFMPYMVGQRCPEWDTNMTGVFFGLRPQHTKAHCIRAIMEGTAFGLAKIAGLLEDENISIRKLVVAGGCAKSNIWMDIFGQVLSKNRLYRSQVKELAAFGAALCAGMAAGIYNGEKEACACCRSEELDFKKHDRERYDKLGKVFVSLYPALKEAFEELRTID